MARNVPDHADISQSGETSGTAVIVVDTNLVAYAFIEGTHTPLTAQVREKDAEWRLPVLWRHEFLNILATYVRHGGMELRQSLAVWDRAMKLLVPCERVVDMTLALHLAVANHISAYDAQFIALAQSLNTVCLTEDRRLLRVFPRFTKSMKQFCS